MSYTPISGAFISDSQDADGRRKKTVLIGGRVVHTVYGDGDEAARAADDWAIEAIGKIESRLGRRLTLQELRRGLDHAETKTPGEILRRRAEYDSYFAPTETDTRTPVERARDEYKAKKKMERDPRLAMLDDAIEKEHQEAERQAAKAKRDADPRVAACIADSGARVLAVLFDPDATQADVRDAQFRERIAKESDPIIYERLTREWQKVEAQRRKERAAPLHARAALLSSEIAAIEKPFTLPATTTEYVKEIHTLPEGLHLTPDPSPAL